MVKRMLKWLLPYIMFMAPSMIGGAVVGLYPGYKAFQYTWVDSKFCTGCHMHDYASQSWKKSIHGGITTCHDCHHQPLIQYMQEAVVLLTKKPSARLELKHLPHVDKHLCESCHWDYGKTGHADVSGPLNEHDLKDIPKTSKSRLHRLHLSKKVSFALPTRQDMESLSVEPVVGPERSIMCVDCHGGLPNRAHNFSATDMACVRCHSTHKEHKFNPSKVQKTFGCRNCHFIEFMVESAAPKTVHE